jgi:hypothetical protein
MEWLWRLSSDCEVWSEAFVACVRLVGLEVGVLKQSGMSRNFVVSQDKRMVKNTISHGVVG